MNKEEIKAMIKDCVYSEDGITYMSNKQYNNYIDMIEQLQQENQSLKKENKILRENAEHNDEVVDKVNWENQKLKKQLEEYKLITIDYQDLEAKNQKLKEQVDYLRRSIERKEETIIDLQNERVTYTNEYVAKLENQQKEFVEYLENEKNIYPYDISEYTYEDIINTILSKYYEIIKKLEKGE